MPINEIIRFIPVSEQLATSGQPSEAQLAELAAAGFELIINLALHDDPRYSLPDEPGCVAALGMDYVHIPVPFSAPTAGHLVRFFEAMGRAENRRTLVHCAHNKRVSVFLALYRFECLGWPVEQARQAMLTGWTPDPVWQAFFDHHAA